jgi:hypothetical protein
VGIGLGVGGTTVGLGIAGVRVDDGVADGVGAAVGVCDGEAVGGRLAVGAPEAVSLGIAAGPAHAAARASTMSATTGRRRNMSGPPNGDSSTLSIDLAVPHLHVPAVMKAGTDRHETTRRNREWWSAVVREGPALRHWLRATRPLASPEPGHGAGRR